MSDLIDHPVLIRAASADDLARALVDARVHTLALFESLRRALADKLEIGYGEHVNPPLWELGHLGWFEEFWIARNPERLRGSAARLEAPRAAPLLARADALYDSSAVAHRTRWHLDLPTAERSLAYLAKIRERTLALLRQAPPDDDSLYFFRLALLHESMHFEAGAMMAQALGLDVADALPAAAPAAFAVSAEGEVGGALAVPACRLRVGEREGVGGFAFDNELGAHTVELAAFEIDRRCTSWGQVLAFVEAGGYQKPDAWSAAGWAWRCRALAEGWPRYLAQRDSGVTQRWSFGRWVDLDLQQPAVNLSWHEAQAYCHWAGRRLPTEHEWLAAVQQHGADCVWGEVWEWTSSPFAAWPGFVAHAYRDYSQPWFDGRPVLKGGSFAAAPRIKHPHYRNFFAPDRCDAFAGFRTCSA